MAVYKDFNHFFNVKNLETLYSDKVGKRASTGLDNINKKTFEKYKNDYFDTISRKVKNNTYNFSPYKEKLILKGRNKNPRLISTPTIRDKITLATIHKILKNAYSIDIRQEIVQTVLSQLKDTLKLKNYDYFIKFDIKNFYDNIDHELLFKALRKKVRKKELLDLIKEAISTPTLTRSTIKERYVNTKGVPQGLSISNILAYIYLLEFDNSQRKQTNFKYFRYVDDILIICKESESKKIKKQIQKQFKKLNLKTNEKEKDDEGYLNKEFNFLGYKIKNMCLGVKEKNLINLRNSLAEIFTIYKYSDFKKKSEFIWNLNLQITGGIIDNKKYGWLFFYSQIDNKKVLHELDWLISEYFRKFSITNVNRDQIKSFVRAHIEIIYNRSKSKYIPNFDNYLIHEKKEFLKYHCNINVKNFNDDKIENYFRKYIFGTLKKLEKDIQHFS